MTVQECVTVINEYAKNSTRFKIGKTGQTTTERFNQEYAGKYARITAICQSTNSKVIDHFESEIIKHFKNYPNNDNDQKGGGSMATSNLYIVYIVWR